MSNDALSALLEPRGVRDHCSRFVLRPHLSDRRGRPLRPRRHPIHAQVLEPHTDQPEHLITAGPGHLDRCVHGLEALVRRAVQRVEQRVVLRAIGDRVQLQQGGHTVGPEFPEPDAQRRHPVPRLCSQYPHVTRTSPAASA
jgi:hypothetical protein